MIKRILSLAWNNISATMLILCIALIWADNLGIISLVQRHHFIAYFGIPFFYICRRLDMIEEKVSLKVSRLVAIMREDTKSET